MLHLANKVFGATVRGVDGPLGTLEDFLFDEDGWVVRYLIVDTGARRLLLSPMAVPGSWDRSEIVVNLTTAQVESSPDVDAATLDRARETAMLEHYRHPRYWGDTNIWGTFPTPNALSDAAGAATPAASGRVATEQALRLHAVSARIGAHIQAADGEIGHIDDFLVDELTWCVRYLLVDTSNWIGGKSVLVRTKMVRGFDPTDGTLRVDAARDVIEHSPSFESIEAAVTPGETGPPFTWV